MTITLSFDLKEKGFGTQYHSKIFGIAYAIYKNYLFINKPFISSSKLTKEEAKKLDDFVGIPLGRNKESDRTYFTIPNDINPNLVYTKYAISEIKRYYYSNSLKPKLNIFEIIIHIRNEPHNHNFIEFKNYFKIINRLKKKYPNYKINIFSTGKLYEFEELKDYSVQIYLNCSIFDVFDSMINCKVLVTSKSSFSYSAALLNNNDIWYIDFMHKPLSHWQVIKLV